MPIAIVAHSNPFPRGAGQFSINSVVQLVLESGMIPVTNDPYFTLGVETVPMAMGTNATQMRANITAAVVTAVNAATLDNGARVLPAGVNITGNEVLHTANYSRG
jgi:hypothetical protein